MDTRVSQIDRLRTEQPAAWSLLKFAATKGLASIDDSHDRVVLTTELRRQRPQTHFALGGAIEEWKRRPIAR
ncbi:MAG: hypothetical protein QF570_21320 [Myxococcota bacterium]|jgi:hypothetical protein|nr:hypothetical protein [Myxococcota bacterium]